MIHFLNLKKLNQPFETAFQKKMKQFLEVGWYILGDEVKQFEKDFATYCGTKHCIGVGNGLDALVLIFKAYIHLGKLQKGDEVIGVAAGFPTTVNPILQFGAVPVFVDVDIPTYNIDVTQLEAAVSHKTKAIMLAHGGEVFVTSVDGMTSFCLVFRSPLAEQGADIGDAPHG